MAQPVAGSGITPIRAAWSEHPQIQRLVLIAVALLLVLGAAVAFLGARAAFAPQSVAAQMFQDVYYAAVFTGRKPDLTVRKARFRTELMMRELGMTRDKAAAYVARIMIEQAGGLCSGI